MSALFPVGALCVLGTGTTTTVPLIVTRVTPGPDLTATIEAVEEALGILEADYKSIPSYAPPTWVPARRLSTDAPRAFTVNPIYTYDSTRQPVVTLSFVWLSPPRTTVAYYTIYEIIGTEWVPLTNTTTTSYSMSYSRLNVSLHGQQRLFGLIAMSQAGSISTPVQANVMVTRDRIPPRAVLRFSSNILTETILLLWEADEQDLDISHYELRFASRAGTLETLGSDLNDWNKMTLLAERVDANERQFTTTARTGVYAISAVDTSGNYGIPAFTRTYIENMPNLDIVILLQAGGGPLDVLDLFMAPLRLSDPDAVRPPTLAPGDARPVVFPKQIDLDYAIPPSVTQQGRLNHAKLVDADTPRTPTVVRGTLLNQLAFGKLVDTDRLGLHIIQLFSVGGGRVYLESTLGFIALESTALPGRMLLEEGSASGPGLQGLGFIKQVNANTLRTPTVVRLNAGVVSPSKLVDADVLKRPTLIPGLRVLGVPRITDTDVVRGPAITLGPTSIAGYYVLTEDGANWIALENGTGRIVQESQTGPLLATPGLRAQVEARDLGRSTPRQEALVRPRLPSGALRVVPALPGPGWIGDYRDTTRTSAELRLDRNSDGTYDSEGWFYSATEFEMAEPMRVRLSSMIDAYGYAAGRTIGGWQPIASAVPLDDTQRGRDWDAEIYIRSLRNPEKLNSAWFSPIGVAAPLVGDIAAQSPWTRLVVGDWDSSLIQWAVRLWSREPNITPSVKWAEVRVDVSERRESSNDTAVPSTGTRILFTSGFWEPPVVSLTLANAPEGARIVRTVDRNGFDIQLVAGGVGVAGVIDWFAMGYGKLTS